MSAFKGQKWTKFVYGQLWFWVQLAPHCVPLLHNWIISILEVVPLVLCLFARMALHSAESVAKVPFNSWSA